MPKITLYLLTGIGLAGLMLGYIWVTGTALCVGTYTPAQYFVEFGDSFSALLTSFSLFGLLYQMKISDVQNSTAISEANRDRTLSVRLGILEAQLRQLEKQLDFYSKLKGTLSQCWKLQANDNLVPLPGDFRAKFDSGDIQFGYELLAEEEVRDYLRTYYSALQKANITAGTGALESLLTLMENLKAQVDSDITDIQSEYSSAIKELKAFEKPEVS